MKFGIDRLLSEPDLLRELDGKRLSLHANRMKLAPFIRQFVSPTTDKEIPCPAPSTPTTEDPESLEPDNLGQDLDDGGPPIFPADPPAEPRRVRFNLPPNEAPERRLTRRAARDAGIVVPSLWPDGRPAEPVSDQEDPGND